MPYNGAGTFSPYTPGNPVVTNTTINSTAFNNTMTDIATGLSNAVTRDGQSPATANLPMGGFKLTGLAAGTANGNSVRYEQVGALALTQGAAASGTNADITSATALATLPAVMSINSGALSGMRNRIINGCMRIDQRNAAAAQTFTAGAALAYCVDRWYGYCTGANVTGQRVAGSGNTQYRYRFTGAASVTKIGFAQRIEAANCYDMNNRTATIGVELANSLLTSVTWTAWYANTEDTFGTLASPTRTQIATGTFTVTSTPTRYYAQMSIPAAATTGIEIEFSVGAQTSGTWTIGEVQFVPGGANELWQEKRPVGVELLLCQRYCQAIRGSVYGPTYGTGLCNSTVAAYLLVPFPVAMRTIPDTCIQSSTVSEFRVFKSGASIASNVTPVFDSGYSTPLGAMMYLGVAAGLTTGDAAFLQLLGSSYLIYSAELWA